MKLHEVVLHAPCLSACLSLLCSSVADPSLICLSVVALFVCRWSIVGLSLVYHWSVTGLSVRVMAVALFVCHWSIVGLSLVYHWSVTGLLESWLLSCHWSVTGLSLVCHWSVTGLSARLICR